MTTVIPHVYDWSMLSSFIACPRQFYEKHIVKIVPKGERVDLVFGKAYATGLETLRNLIYEEEWDQDEALIKAYLSALKELGEFEFEETDKKNEHSLFYALEEYTNQWSVENDPLPPHIFHNGKKGIELSFAVELPIKHPVDGQPLTYAGRIDMLSEYCGTKLLYVLDDKTTSRMGQTWSENWDMRGQFLGYVWAMRKELNLNIAGFGVRGMCIRTYDVEGQEILQMVEKHRIKLWYNQLLKTLERLINCAKDNYWDLDFSDACTSFRGCPYKEICTAKNPEGPRRTLFVPNTWSPIRVQTEESQNG